MGCAELSITQEPHWEEVVDCVRTVSDKDREKAVFFLSLLDHGVLILPLLVSGELELC